METQRFVRMFDKFFDCLNTRHPDAGVHALKPDLSPYRTPLDSRLKVYIIINYTDNNIHNVTFTVVGGRVSRLPGRVGG